MSIPYNNLYSTASINSDYWGKSSVASVYKTWCIQGEGLIYSNTSIYIMC